MSHGDLIMLVRPGMLGRGLCDILIEFKHLPANKVTEGPEGKRRRLEMKTIKTRSEAELMALPNVKAQLDKATTQLQGYGEQLRQKYQDDLNLYTYAVLSLGFDRILWKKIEVTA